MNVAMRLLEKKKELPKKEKFLKKSLLEAQKNLTDAYAGLDSVHYHVYLLELHETIQR